MAGRIRTRVAGGRCLEPTGLRQPVDNGEQVRDMQQHGPPPLCSASLALARQRPPAQRAGGGSGRTPGAGGTVPQQGEP